jgi:hypothetical protein
MVNLPSQSFIPCKKKAGYAQISLKLFLALKKPQLLQDVL